MSTWQRRLLNGLGVVALVIGLGTLSVMFSNRANSTQDVLAASVLAETTAPAVTSSTTTTSTTSSSTTTTTVPLRVATLAFTGDTLSHRGVVRQAQQHAQQDDAPVDAEYDFAPMFDLVQPYLASADLAICHLETPLSIDNTRLSGYPTFNVPHELADGLVAAGYDGCTTASNHSLDRRTDGVVATLDVLDEAGLAHSGMARSQAEYNSPTIYDANGISVASLSYSYGFNGFTEPAETPWLVNEIDVAEIAAEVEAARAEGAEYVVVSLHWGTEYRYDPNQYQLDNANAIAAIPGVDLLIGHHAHVVQPVDLVGDTPVVFGLGNFLSNQSSNCCAAGSQDGMIMQVHIHEQLDRGGFDASLTYVPTRVDRSDFVIVPVNDALVKDGLGTLGTTELQRSQERTAEVVTRMGNRAQVSEAGPLDAVGSIGEAAGNG